MSAHRLRLRSANRPGLVLRSIDVGDLEDLRRWKNANRDAFFSKKEINRDDQRRWFSAYRKRPDDWMFVVESGGERAGCLGFRLHEGVADVYNVIGAPAARGKGIMKEAMRVLCSYLRAELGERAQRIEAKVVRGNPALEWYRACGYEVAAEQPEHVVVELCDAFEPVPYVKEPA